MNQRTIWIVDAKNSRRGGLRTPRGPHLVLRDEPAIGETVVAKLRARPSRWASEADGAAVIEWVVRLDQPLLGTDNGYGGVVRLWSEEATVRGLGDDSDPHEPRDFTNDVCREILCAIGEWDAASCRVELLDGPEADRSAPQPEPTITITRS
jgi:hypothetical protein